MRKFFFVLVLCALLGVNGSKSKKKKNGRLMGLIKTGLIVLVGNEIANAKNSQVDSNALACKYIVPDQNAAVMLKFAVCAQEQDFEKYLVDNSDNCSEFKKVYEKTKEYAKCASTTSKSIIKGALVKLGGEQLSQETNMEMLQEFLLSLGKSDKFYHFRSERLVSRFLQDLQVSSKENFDFFRFKRIYDLGYHFTNDHRTVRDALGSKFDDIDLDHVEDLLELTKQLYEFKWQLVNEALEIALDSKWKNVNVVKAKQVLEFLLTSMPQYMKELIELDYGDKTTPVFWSNREEHVKFNQRKALMEALKIEKNVNDVNHAKRLFKLFSHCAYGTNWDVSEALKLKQRKDKYDSLQGDKATHEWFVATTSLDAIDRAAREALNPKYENVNVEKVYEKYDELKSSWSSWWFYGDEKAMINDAFKLTYPDIIKKEF